MVELTEAQEKLLRKAVIRSDRWEEYVHLKVNHLQWMRSHRNVWWERFIRKYIEGSSPKETHLECGSNSSDLTSAIKLAVSYGEPVDSYRIATSTLEDIWSACDNTWLSYTGSWTIVLSLSSISRITHLIIQQLHASLCTVMAGNVYVTHHTRPMLVLIRRDLTHLTYHLHRTHLIMCSHCRDRHVTHHTHSMQQMPICRDLFSKC